MEDRRSYPRYYCDLPIRSLISGGTYLGNLINFSENGCLLSFPVNQNIVVDVAQLIVLKINDTLVLGRHHDMYRFDVKARVQYIKRLHDELQIGCYIIDKDFHDYVMHKLLEKSLNAMKCMHINNAPFVERSSYL